MTDKPTRMTPAELRDIRETVEVDTSVMARWLSMRPDTYRKIEATHPRHPVPYRVRDDLRAALVRHTETVRELLRTL